MPAFILSNSPKTLSKYDVVGEYVNDDFVRHVALLDADDADVAYGQGIDVAHMGPPLKRDKQIESGCAGQVPLTNDEMKEVSAWIEEIEDEYRESRANAGRQYIVHPPFDDWCDSNTGVRRYRRFSCAGFVLNAYSEVGIELLALDDDALPQIDESTLKTAYPQIDSSGLRNRYGLEGGGPWQIVLAGYVLHALGRPTEEIRQQRYQAQPGDERF